MDQRQKSMINNGVKGSYEHVLKNLRHFAEIKNPDQDICAVINVMPHTVAHMEEIMLSTAAKLNGSLSAFVIQRIAPSGRASGEVKWFIERQDIDPLMKVFDKIIREDKYPIEFCDVFPWCSVKPEYQYMLPKGGCNWGKEVCAVYMDGTVKRCAMASNDLSKKMTELTTPEKWRAFWDTDPELVAFRRKLHLDEACKSCELLQECGGSCVLARESGDPYDNTQPIDPATGKIKTECLEINGFNPQKGHDYLSKRR